MNHCPCCSGKLYEECCGLYISGKKPAPSAETLMRSRYTAYTKADMDYIERTMKGPAALSFNRIESEKWARASEWEKLEVLRSQEIPNTGIVEFIVYF
jgi:SEC-C motif-containing protein